MVDQKINVDIVTENYLTGFAPIYSVLQNQSIQIINRTSVHTICYLFKFNNYSTPIPKHQRVHLAQTKSTTDHKPIELSNIMSSPGPIPKSPIQSSRQSFTLATIFVVSYIGIIPTIVVSYILQFPTFCSFLLFVVSYSGFIPTFPNSYNS